jgi:carbonic anhydrase
MGHTKCGAVTAAVQGANEPGALGQLLARLKPAAQDVAYVSDDQKVPEAVKKNVALGAQLLATQSPVLASAVAEGRTKIIGAVYQLEDGRVIFY